MGPADGVLEQLAFDAGELFAKHPPNWEHRNKAAVYAVSCPPGCTHGGRIEYTRWKQMRLPDAVASADSTRCVTGHEGGFNYEPVLDEPNAVEWHVNFADPDLFFAYGTALFAQDEIQVSEHPALAALREALDARGLPARTTEGGRATPVLVKGVERRCRVMTRPDAEAGRPQGLYGNRFAGATEEAVRNATIPIEPPTITNLIAMAAPAGGFDLYTRDEIEYVLATAYTGFRAAVLVSGDGPVAVHTGFWGCGAFGGNRVLMAMLQTLAAGAAGLDRLVFHTFDPEGSEALDEALRAIGDHFPEDSLRPEDVLDRIEAMGFEWGISDGN